MILFKHFRENQLPHRVAKKTKAITVAIKILDTHTIDLAFSVCHHTDKFTKKKARDIAYGRLTKPRFDTRNVLHNADLETLDLSLGADCFHPSIQSCREFLATEIDKLVTYELTIPRTKKAV